MKDEKMSPAAPSRRSFMQTVAFAAAGLAVPGAWTRQMLAGVLGDNRLSLVRHSTYVMGQIANVTIFHEDPEMARGVVTSIFAELRRLESMMSVFDERSGLSAVNRAAGREAVAVAPELADIVRRSVEVARRTDSAFDITVEPLLRLWGFRGGHRTSRPSDREIQTVLEGVGPELVSFERGDSGHGGAERIGLLRPGAALDLGGVAVGYALDRCAALARERGITSALLELSGDYYAIGAPPERASGWEIAIADPRGRGRAARVLDVRDAALATSANYASAVVYDARRYGHIFDPDRGVPAARVRSASVMAGTAFDADAHSTALFVDGNTAALPAGARGIVL